jgi:hypothetical protein
VNQTKTRLQALGLLDRALRAASDDELEAIVTTLDDEHRDALGELTRSDEVTAEAIRSAIGKGRLDGTMESVAVVLSDACLADCIEKLGDDADNPSSDQLREVLPGIVDRHGVPCTRIMLASTVAGEAAAAAIIRDLLKHDDVVKLPPVEPQPVVSPLPHAPTVSPEERAAIKERRRQLKLKKQADARARREQSTRDRSR